MLYSKAVNICTTVKVSLVNPYLVKITQIRPFAMKTGANCGPTDRVSPVHCAANYVMCLPLFALSAIKNNSMHACSVISVETRLGVFLEPGGL